MRSLYTCLAASLLLAALSACGTLPASRVLLENEVTRGTEEDGRFIVLIGPRRQHEAAFLGVPSTNYFTLRSWVDTRNGQDTNQVYVEDSYFGDKRDWNAARDARGHELRFIPVSKNEIACANGCSYAEEFAAAIPEPLLRASTQGLQVTFFAKSGATKTISVPGDLVTMQVTALDAALASLPKPTAAATPPRP